MAVQVFNWERIDGDHPLFKLATEATDLVSITSQVHGGFSAQFGKERTRNVSKDLRYFRHGVDRYAVRRWSGGIEIGITRGR